MRIKCRPLLGMVNLSRGETVCGTSRMDKKSLTCSIIATEARFIFVAAEKPDCDIESRAIPTPLLQFGRRRMVEHGALGAIDQVKSIGLDGQRATFARQPRDPFDMGKGLLEIKLPVAAHLVDIEQLAFQQR